MADRKTYESFEEFYPDYLREHQNCTSRRLHFFGTTLVILMLAGIIVNGAWAWLIAIPFAGYGPAWLGHFYFERNRPATFQHPLYSLMGDFRMYSEMWTRKIPL